MPERRWRPATPSATESPFGGPVYFALHPGDVPGYSRAPVAWTNDWGSPTFPASEILTRREIEVDTGVGVVDLDAYERLIGERLDGDDTDYDTGTWFCLATLPFPCPAAGCSYVAEFVTARHLIVVWPSNDDRAMLRVARKAQAEGRAPRVREYEAAFGQAVSWDRWHQLGSPVHGIRGGKSEKPEWW